MADRLRRSHPEVRIVILSAHIRDGYIAAAFAAGVSAYFAKSDELQDIVAGIRTVIRERRKTFILGPRVLERCRPPVGARRSEVNESTEADPNARPITRLSSLTKRETQILRLIGQGLSRAKIAAVLCRSVKTIDGHQARLMNKLCIHARADLMRFAIREGLCQI